MMFQPVSTSGSKRRTRSQKACSAARSVKHRTACGGIGRSLPSTMSTSSIPGAYSEIASRRSFLPWVSMSKDRTRGSILTSAGRSAGLSNTRSMPLPATPSPLISQPPLIPRSIR